MRMLALLSTSLLLATTAQATPHALISCNHGNFNCGHQGDGQLTPSSTR